MNAKQEAAYIRGRRSLARRLIKDLERELGRERTENDLKIELAETREQLEDLFEEFGLEDFREDTYLPDLIEKVLFRQLQARLESSEG